MKFISRFLIKMACWLSPRNAPTYMHDMLYRTSSTPNPSDEPSGQPSMPSKPAPNISAASDSILQHSVEKARLEMEQAREVFEAAESAKMAVFSKNLPHRVYGMTVLSHDGASWIAEAQLKNTSLVGRGPSPAEALMDFDNQWLGIK